MEQQVLPDSRSTAPPFTRRSVQALIVFTAGSRKAKVEAGRLDAALAGRWWGSPNPTVPMVAGAQV